MQGAPAEFTVTESHLAQRRKAARWTVIFIALLCAVLGVTSLVTSVLAFRDGDALFGVLFLGFFALILFFLLSSRTLYSRLVGQLAQRRVTLERKQLVDTNDKRTKSVALRDVKRLEVVRSRQGELLAFNVQTEASTLSFAGLENMATLLGALSSLGHVSVTERTKWLYSRHAELQFALYVGLGALLAVLSEVVAPTLSPSPFTVVITGALVGFGGLELLRSRDADTRYLREKRRSGVTLVILGVLLLVLELL